MRYDDLIINQFEDVDVKKSANSYKRKNIERLTEQNINDTFDEENTDTITKRIELYKHQIERKIENVKFIIF